MSYTSVGKNKVYASINDLPVHQKIIDGDKILIQTENGTALIDYENFIIDLNHTTFKSQYNNVIDFVILAENQFENLITEINALKEKINSEENTPKETKISVENEVQTLESKIQQLEYKILQLESMHGINGESNQ